MRIAINNLELGQRGGISTYGNRLCRYLNELDDVEAKQFVNRYRNGKADVISVQYEPGMCPPQVLDGMLKKYTQPIVVTAHHILGLQQFYPML